MHTINDSITKIHKFKNSNVSLKLKHNFNKNFVIAVVNITIWESKLKILLKTTFVGSQKKS